MGQPKKIIDLAKQMIFLSGLKVKDKENPDGDIEIITTGLRPGEKLYEELLIAPEQVEGTTHPRIFRSYEPLPETTIIQAEVGVLKKAITENDVEAALSVMCSLVPEYGPSGQSQILESHSILDGSSSAGWVN